MPLIPGLSFDDYRALPGINGSLLRMVHAQSLEHVKAELDGVTVRESDALDFGHSFHELLLRGRQSWIERPATYPAPAHHDKVKAFQILAGDPLPWNANAAWCKMWEKQHEGQQVHDPEEVSGIRGMVAKLRAHPEVLPLLDGDCEISVTAERDEVPVKCLVDLLPHDPALPVVDFKSCLSCNPEQFVKSAIDKGYHIQAAFTLDCLRLAGFPRRAFTFVAIEKKPPYAVTIMPFHDEPGSYVRVGRKEYRAAMARLLKARESNYWPSYPTLPAEHFAPAWHREQLESTL